MKSGPRMVISGLVTETHFKREKRIVIEPSTGKEEQALGDWLHAGKT